jgi:hypothetical protein
VTQDIAYFWSAKRAIGTGWCAEVERTVEAMPGVVLELADGDEARLVLADGVHAPVEWIFARRRGGGSVRLASGPRLILASLTVAVRLELALSDAKGEAFDAVSTRSWLTRIPFAEGAREIERTAEEIGFLERRVHLNELARSAPGAKRSVFFG